MQEILTLFDSICNSRWLVKTSIVHSSLSLFPFAYWNAPLRFCSWTRLISSPRNSFTPWELLPRLPGRIQLRRRMRLPPIGSLALTRARRRSKIYAHYAGPPDTQRIKRMYSFIIFRVMGCYFWELYLDIYIFSFENKWRWATSKVDL